jgi:hypothetical protein
VYRKILLGSQPTGYRKCIDGGSLNRPKLFECLDQHQIMLQQSSSQTQMLINASAPSENDLMVCLSILKNLLEHMHTNQQAISECVTALYMDDGA